VEATLPVCVDPHHETELDVAFNLGLDQTGPNEPDLDNLLEPLLSVMVNARRWFAGRRPAITGIAAIKQHHRQTGCSVTVAEKVEEPWDPEAVAVAREFRYPGPLPTSARDPVLAEWLISELATPLSTGRIALTLRFGAAINLGDIATGPVKTTTDGLWPLLGGRPGAPADRRISSMLLRRSNPGAPPRGALITPALLSNRVR